MKRILISLIIGLLFPGLVFLLLVFSKIFTGPRPLPDFLFYFYIWPRHTPLWQVWCRVLPTPNTVIGVLLFGYLVDALLPWLFMEFGLSSNEKDFAMQC